MAAKKKVPIGRPTKYKKEFCGMLFDHLSEGYSYESFAGLIGVTRDCLYKWEKSQPDFLYTKKTGIEKSLLVWEKHGMDALWTEMKTDAEGKTIPAKKFNTTLWIFNMKNRFGWSDKSEVTHDVSSDAKLIIEGIDEKD